MSALLQTGECGTSCIIKKSKMKVTECIAEGHQRGKRLAFEQKQKENKKQNKNRTGQRVKQGRQTGTGVEER